LWLMREPGGQREGDVMAEKLGHRPGLDQIRAVAVLAVLWGHSVRSGPLRYAGGSVGVAVFFTLSGFLITRLMVEERDRTGRLDLRAFYLRRARRLLPPLPLAFGLCVGGAVVLGDDWQRPLAAALTYSINYSDGARSTFSHLWSLAIEEHFYLVWPVVLAITPRRRIVTVALVVGSLSMTARLIVAPSDVAGTATHLSLGGLLLGARRALPPRCRLGAGLMGAAPHRGRLAGCRVLRPRRRAPASAS
jgi:peptidoglycan/LPS O-acetylase OafA/YrhL